MTDNFSARRDILSTPGRNVYTITPHATNEIDPLPRAVRFNAPGSVTFRTVDSSSDVTVNVQAGEQLVMRMKYIRVAGTTATGILGIE